MRRIKKPAPSAPIALAHREARAFSAIAFGALARGTVSSTSACRAGVSQTCRQPAAKEIAITCQTRIVPMPTSQPMAAIRGNAAPETASN